MLQDICTRTTPHSPELTVALGECNLSEICPQIFRDLLESINLDFLVFDEHRKVRVLVLLVVYSFLSFLDSFVLLLLYFDEQGLLLDCR